MDKYTDIEGEPDFIVIGVNASKSIAQISKMFYKSFTVSMKSGQCYENGACVSFSTKNGRPTYDISQKNIERHGIKVIAKLYELGNKID